jgi:predicted membrane-bound spermidine synthase
MATLLVELSVTRIFSVVLYYHFAFLAISIALFGLGAGGVFSYVVASWKAPLFLKLGRLSALNSLLVVVALVVILAQKGDVGELGWGTFWKLAAIYFSTALPFFVSGAIVSLAVSETMERVNRVYFFDLLGAACGCLLLMGLLRVFDGESTVLAAAVIFAATAAIWHSMAGSAGGRAASVALALALVAFVTVNKNHHILDIRHAKGNDLPAETFVRWNTFSRIALVDKKAEGRQTIVIDADASTDIATFDLDHLTAGERHDLLSQGPSLPYAVRPGAKALIIGPGGGWDVARALASGSRDITGVEINPIIATTIMRQRYPALSHGLYLRPEVHIVVEDGRSFVRRSTDRFQVVQATLVDTWASTAAGAFALSENNLYTVDALRDYLEHLTDDGVVAFTRWGFDPPRESLRLVSLAREALAELGERDAARHVMVGREGSVAGWGARDTVLISRRPFPPADIESARALFDRAHMQAVYLPGVEARNPFYDLLTSADPAAYERAYRFDITPVTDNRPFFFFTVQPRDLWTFFRTASHLSADYKAANQAVPLLFGLMGVSLVAVLLILVAPPLLLGTRLPRHRGVRVFLLYFLFIGAGYIFIEVGLIQKFVLFLGHPTDALTGVIFSLLISSGLGSFFSRRLVGDSDSRLIKVLGLVAILATALALVISGTLTALVWLPWGVKMGVTVALIAPLGFVMGMPFPSALKRLEEWHAPSVRWAWSLNAAASVFGSVGALVAAIYLGLMQTLVMGGLFYLAALAVAAQVHWREAAPPEPPGPGATRVVLAK